MIYDCFTFYNEYDVLRKRLRYLYRHVDKFVLVESSVTHSGEPKELFFENNKGLFSEYLDKIVHVIVQDNPTDDNPWSRENHQRNCITRGLDPADLDHVVMISDVDEIPCHEVVTAYRGRSHTLPAAVVHMTAFQYNFGFMQTHEPWFGTVMTMKSNVIKQSPQYFRNERWKFPVFRESGWHLSSFGDAKHVHNKIKTFAHCNDGIHPTQTEADFECIVSNGMWTDGTDLLARTPDDVRDAIPKELLL
jgi:beta-1,4-mannosyl-glycoprotein beta-1,4-N-acetylglucosaminyltransferase